MIKKFIIILVMLAIFLPGAVYYNQSRKLIKSLTNADYVLSYDGTVEPGKVQSFLVYVFSKDVGNERLPLNARIETMLQNGSFKKVGECINLKSNEGPYEFSFVLPADFSSSTAWFNLYPGSFASKPVFSKPLNIANEVSIAVLAENKKKYCGDWLTLKILAYSNKTFSGFFRAPIRVKMTPPFGIPTVNRVLTTETDGSCVFTTFINPVAPPGLYQFEITHGSEYIKLSQPVFSAAQKISDISLNSYTNGFFIGKPLFSKSPEIHENYSYMPEPENKVLNDLKLGNNQLLFSFDCPGSTIRSIEAWQNGILLNQSFLPYAKGRSTHPLPKGFSRKFPLRIKIWQIIDKKLVSEIYTIQPEQRNNNVAAFLRMIKKSMNGESAKEQFTFNRTPSGIAATYPVTDDSSAGKSIKIDPESDLLKQLNMTTGLSDNLKFLRDDSHANLPTSRFFIVDSELDLSRYNIEQMKIHLSRKSFFKRLIASLYHTEANIEHILTEAETRILRFENLPIPEQSSELEKLEGLLIPIVEFIQISDAHKQKLAGLRQRTFQLLARMHKLIFLPESLAVYASAEKPEPAAIGPASSVLDGRLSLETLTTALRCGGKAKILTKTGSYPLSLTSEIVDYCKNGLSGNLHKPVKLVNLRTSPLLVELVFSGSGKLR
ncbi:MAG: hypothetical protein Kow0029_18700 [Candidatus Rifleibacteriota bacterium]